MASRWGARCSGYSNKGRDILDACWNVRRKICTISWPCHGVLNVLIISVTHMIPCSILRSMLPMPPWVVWPNTIACGYVRGKPILLSTIGPYFFCKSCSCVVDIWHTLIGSAILATKHAFQWINAHFAEPLLQTSALERQVALASRTSNWSSCFV